MNVLAYDYINMVTEAIAYHGTSINICSTNKISLISTIVDPSIISDHLVIKASIMMNLINEVNTLFLFINLMIVNWNLLKDQKTALD